MMKNLYTKLCIASLCIGPYAQAAVVDVFIATGQSNAYWPVGPAPTYEGSYDFGKGVQDALTASGLFSNPTVVLDGQPGIEIAQWHDGTNPQWLYNGQFFNTAGGAAGSLEAQMNSIIANGDTPVFRGLFWFQGEADGQNGTEAQYAGRWNSLLTQLGSDLGSTSWNYVMNRVGNSGDLINDTLAAITTADSRGVLFDTQVAPYRTNPADIHGYDHFAVGQANAQLFISSFMAPEPSTTSLSLASLVFLCLRRRR